MLAGYGALLLATSAAGFARTPTARWHAVRASVHTPRVRPLASSPLDDPDDRVDEGLALAAEFEIAMRRTVGLDEIRAREAQTFDRVIEQGKIELAKVKAELDADLERIRAESAERSRELMGKAASELDAKFDAAERTLRAQAEAVRRGETVESAAALVAAAAAAAAAGPTASARAAQARGAVAAARAVVLIGQGGPLMRAVASALATREGVSVRAVIAGEGSTKGRREDTLPSWPPTPPDAVGDAATERRGPPPPFELVSAGNVPAGRFAVQRAVAGASAILVCLVDGEGREWCLDEPSARRWLDGAGGAPSSASAAGAIALPLPLAPDDARGRLVVVASAQGTNRAGIVPYVLQNLWGQLDQWRTVEQDARLGSQARGFDYTVAHFGKLLPANSGGGGDALRLGVGDALSAGTPLAVAAEALARVLSGAVPSARNASFSLEGGSEATLRDEPRWADEFLKLSGPELARLPLGAAADRRATLSWLHDFGASFKKAPNTLPTPVRIDTLDDGVKFVFLKSGFELSRNGYEDKDKTYGDKAGGDAGGKAAADPAVQEAERAAALKGRPDGALRIILDAAPGGGLRVRVVRSDMTDGATVKEMSESAILRRLSKELPGRA